MFDYELLDCTIISLKLSVDNFGWTTKVFDSYSFLSCHRSVVDVAQSWQNVCKPPVCPISTVCHQHNCIIAAILKHIGVWVSGTLESCISFRVYILFLKPSQNENWTCMHIFQGPGRRSACDNRQPLVVLIEALKQRSYQKF